MHWRELVCQLRGARRVGPARRQIRIVASRALGPKVVPVVAGSRGRGKQLGTLLFHLHRAHAPDGLFALDALLFARLQDLFVLDTQLAALDVEAVERGNNRVCVLGKPEIGKSQTAKLALGIKMVVERVRRRDRQGRLQRD